MLSKVQKIIKIEYPEIDTRLVESSEHSIFRATLYVAGKTPFNLVDLDGGILCSKDRCDIIGDRVANIFMNIRKYLNP